MSKPVTVELVGGLGNQLFGYYAGAALAAHHQVPLRLDISRTRQGFTDHGIAIRDFDLPGTWTSASPVSHRLADRALGRLASPTSVPERAVARVYRQFPAVTRWLRVYQAGGVGEDQLLWDQPPGTRIKGYFQSWRTVDAAVSAGYPRRPELLHPSRWLEEIQGRAISERPIAVHVRRGDYRRVPEFGLLGTGYYVSALEYLRTLGFTGPIWVFTDEPLSVGEALGLKEGYEIIQSPDGPAAEMLAMSHATAQVIANSTFSWWGAWMNDGCEAVIAPDPWFRSGPTVSGLIPPWWHLVNSVL